MAEEAVKSWAKRRWDFLFLGFVLVLSLVLMLRSYNHILSFDEAWNAVTVSASVAGKTSDIFFFNFYRHPPLYLGLSIIYAHLAGDGVSFMKLISMLSGLGTIIVLFFTLKNSLGKRAASFGSFLLATMPVFLIFSTWVKQDALALFLASLFIYFFLKERYECAGIFLGLALLTKEIAIFALLGAGAYCLLNYSGKKIAGFFRSTLIGFLVCFWWFLFFSKTVGEFTKFFLGTSPVNAMFKRPWSYYIVRLPADFSYGTVLLVILGCAFLIKKSHNRESSVNELVLLAALWAFLEIAILTLSAGKPLWMIHSASFPLAILGGFGFDRLYSVLSSRRTVFFVLAVFFIFICLLQGFALNHNSYMEKSKSWGDTFEDWNIAQKLNLLMSKNSILLMSIDDLSPNLMYYLKTYKPDSIIELPVSDKDGNILTSAPFGRVSGKNIYLIDGDFPVGLVLSYVSKIRPDWVMVKERADGTLSTGIARALSKLAPSKRVERALIFRGSDLEPKRVKCEP